MYYILRPKAIVLIRKSPIALCLLLIGLLSFITRSGAQTCPPPTGVSASPVSVCLGSPVTLSATIPSGTTTINWYTVSTGGTAIATTTSASTTYTPTAAGTYTFYAESASGSSGGPGTPQNFSYTGAVQTVTLPAGTYTLECWGANGGKGFQTSQIANNGRGGYSSGTLTLAAAQTISIYVGGAGTDANGTTAGQIAAGGFNGGGASGANNYTTVTQYRGAAGGGATDVRVGGTALTDRVIVAGGGGGGVYLLTYRGGDGGGATGGNGGNTYHGTGGSQTAGGLANGSTGNIAGTPGALGIGGNGGTAASKSGGGGGGGGYYGGGGGATGNTSSSQGGGGGGSSYIGGVTSGTTIMFGQTGFVANPDATGNGYVRITPLSSGCVSTRVATAVVTVNVLPTVDITPATADICSGSSVALTASGATSYSWSPATGLSATTGSTVTASPTTTTTYTVTGTSNGCTATATRTVVVTPTPNVQVSPATATAICTGSDVTLTASGATTYTWSPATGLSATTGTSVIANPTTTTTYTIVGDDGSGCTGTTTKTITVNALPGINITPTAPITICAGSNTSLTASGGSTYTWSPATGLSSTTGANVTATPSATITYTVTGTDANGCTNTATKLVTVSPQPTVTILPTGSSGICIGANITLSATGASTYSWSPSASLSAPTGANVTATPPATTTYTVTGTSTNGCVGTASKTVTVSAVPVLTLLPSTPPNICAGASVSLIAAGALTYSWSPATGLSSTNTAATVATPGATITYTLTGSNNGCSATATKTITVTPVPVATITASGSTNLCTGNSVTLNANTGTGFTYMWRTNGVDNGSTGSSFIANAGGNYQVVITNGLCSNVSPAVNVVINTPPVALLTTNGPTTFCAGNTLRISAPQAANYTYQWQYNNVDIPGATNADYYAANAGDYRVAITNISCSIPSSTITTTVNPLPAASITALGTTSFCDGGAVTLAANSGTGLAYQWTRYGVNIPGATSINYVANTTGIYSVKVTNTQECTGIAAGIPVQAVAAPLPEIVVINGRVLITQSFMAYQWYRNGVPIPGATNVDYLATQDGTYTVEVTIMPGCTKMSTPIVVNSLSVGSSKVNNVSFHPNPTSGNVKIVSDIPVDVTLCGVDGKLILREKNAKELNVAHLADGIYILRFFDREGLLIKTERLNKASR